jgi:hypothetical protein
MRMGSICIECFYLKVSDHGGKGRCDKLKFKEHLFLNHPFLTLPRACPDFDEDLPEVKNEVETD